MSSVLRRYEFKQGEMAVVTPPPSGVIMKAMLKAAFPRFFRRRQERRHLNEFGNNYLFEKGWFSSASSREAVDRNGPVLWVTYAARSMIERMVGPTHRVFEYGSGNSSLWWAARAADVVSVEHYHPWAEKIKKSAPGNLVVVCRPANTPVIGNTLALLEEFLADEPDLPSLGTYERDLEHGMLTREFAAYALEIARYPKGSFDIVVVDGMARSFCAWLAARWVSPSGIVIFDNSNRWQYNSGYSALAEKGFRRVDFFGPSPVLEYESCTSIFCRGLDWLPANGAVSKDQAADPEWRSWDR